MASRYEKNIALQPGLIRAILASPRPAWMDELKPRPVYFVGVGTSFHLAQIAKMLWRRHVSLKAHAAHSFDFARIPQPAGKGDVVVLLSHRGTKSYTVESANAAHKAGATTVGITSVGSPWKDSLDHKIEACEAEDTGAFTKSMTSTLAWIARWIDAPNLTKELLSACGNLEAGPSFPMLGPDADVVLLGDLEREWIAREISLKLQEAAYLRARPFGLEEFLHGPRISVDAKSSVLAFVSEEPRWQTVREYLKAVEVPLLEIKGGWLEQLFWGQRFTAEACRQLGLDPDTLRTQDPRYKKAREALSL
ncbi:MAG: SIS domain-containing protein [Elusimicrobia bacterium]|nr:SIS domain-containing protein [Elusimicrobiota bacterium]